MAWEAPGPDVPFAASADISAYQYCFMGMPDSSGQVTFTGAGEHILGILQNKPAAAGRGASVRVYGVSKLVVDGNVGAIVPGDRLISDAAGKGVKGETDNNEMGAIALEASTAAGEIISVLVIPGVRY